MVPTRPVTRILALLLVLAGVSEVHAQTSPQTSSPQGRALRIIVPFGPGGLADITMRLVGQKLTERTGQQIVVENRPSAGGIVAAAALTSAAADGTTLFVLSSGIAISRSVLRSMPFDPVTAFQPISTVAFFDLLILANSDSPLRSLSDVLAAARNDPAKFNVGTINPGSTQNVSAEFLRSAAGIQMTIVPFRTTPELTTAVLRHDVTIAVESYAAMKAQIDEGQLRAVASTGDKRYPFWLPCNRIGTSSIPSAASTGSGLPTAITTCQWTGSSAFSSACTNGLP